MNIQLAYFQDGRASRQSSIGEGDVHNSKVCIKSFDSKANLGSIWAAQTFLCLLKEVPNIENFKRLSPGRLSVNFTKQDQQNQKFQYARRQMQGIFPKIPSKKR